MSKGGFQIFTLHLFLLIVGAIYNLIKFIILDDSECASNVFKTIHFKSFERQDIQERDLKCYSKLCKKNQFGSHL